LVKVKTAAFALAQTAAAAAMEYVKFMSLFPCVSVCA
jgi:hypothetical protein